MSALATLQREFLAAVAGDGEPGDDGLQVYRRNYLGNAHAALAAAYPVVRRLVGASFFEEAAARYAVAFPSTSGDLGERGAAFADFLSGYPPAAVVQCLPDVARLEWALHESERAPDAHVLDPAALARVTPDAAGSLRLAVHPAVRIVASVHPVLSIWEANQPGRDGTPGGDGSAETACVGRAGESARALRIDPPAARLLAAFMRGATLDEACDALGPEAPQHLAVALRTLAQAGVFAATSLPPR